MPPDSRMFHSKYFFSVWFGHFLWGGVIYDNWECLQRNTLCSLPEKLLYSMVKSEEVEVSEEDFKRILAMR